MVCVLVGAPVAAVPPLAWWRAHDGHGYAGWPTGGHGGGGAPVDVPEPGMAVLVGGAVAGLVYIKRRKVT